MITYDKMIKKNELINIFKTSHYSTKLHNHDFIELVYVADGSAEHSILNGSSITVKKGNYFIVDHNTMHKFTTKKDSMITVVNCLFLPAFVDKVLTGCETLESILNHYLIHLNCKTLRCSPADTVFDDEDGSVWEIINTMLCEYKEKNVGYIEVMRCKLIELLIKIARNISDKENSALYSDISLDIIKYIESEYMNHITLGTACQKYNYSLPYLSRKFKNDVGVSFVNYLQNVRIEEGCRLLLNTEKRVGEIANMIGYEDIKFFNQTFKKILNTTPREFRKLHKE